MAMSIKGLLAEACRIPSKNRKLAYFVLALSLIPHLLLFLVQYIFMKFLFHKQTDQIMAHIMAVASTQRVDYEGLFHKEMEVAKGFMIFLVITLIVTILILVFQSIMVIHWADETRFQVQMAPEDFISKVSKTWKVTLITILLIDALWLCYLGALVCLIAMEPVVFNSSTLLGLSIVVISVLVLASFIYGAVVTNLASVISVVEDDCYGFGAVKGRRMQGCLLTLAIVGTGFSFFFVYGFLPAMLAVGKFSWVLRLFQVSLFQMMVILNMAAYSVFYRDCQESRNQFAGLELHCDKLPTEV